MTSYKQLLALYKKHFFHPLCKFIKYSVLGAVCIVLFTLSVQTAHAAADLPGKVASLLSDELPELRSVLPDYIPPAENAPSLAIGDFYTESNDKIDWGRALGELLRTSLAGYLDMPSRRVARKDAWYPGVATADLMRSVESLAFYHERYGTQAIVTGKVVVNEAEFQWTVHIMSLPERKTLQKMVGSGALADLPEILEKVRVKVLNTVGYEGATDWQDLSAIHSERLKEYGRLLYQIEREPGMDVFAASSAFIRKDYDLIPSVLLYIEHYPSPEMRDEIREKQDEFTRFDNKYPESAAVKLCLARNMISTSAAHHVMNNKINALKKYVSSYPDDPMGFVLLADVLASNNFQLEGIVVSLEALRRWPDNFRAWWDLAWTLESYAWRLRGHDYWKNVPEEGRRMFPILKALSLDANRKALELNRDNAKLWHQNMAAIGKFNSEFKNAFRRAIELHPYYRDAYETALNYASPKWGGTVREQQKILELARRNNPGATWIDEIAKKHVSEESVKTASLFELVVELLDRFIFE